MDDQLTADAVVGEAPVRPALSCHDLIVQLGPTTVLDGVSVVVDPGQWLTVVGPNGAGKSTLLRAVTGAVSLRSGSIEIAGQPLASMRSGERARAVAMVAQAPVVPAGMTVAEYVLLGRSPHIPRFGTERRRDLEATREALALLDLTAFAGRALGTLSGGERQRAFIARALAQAAPLVLLDEPTTALDVGHQQEVLELVDDLRRQRGLTVVSTMHDLTLAGQYADRLVLIDGGRVVVAGPAADVLTPETLSRHYGAHVHVITDTGGSPVVVPLRAPRAATGPPHVDQGPVSPAGR